MLKKHVKRGNRKKQEDKNLQMSTIIYLLSLTVRLETDNGFIELNICIL